jgi:3-oxoadipate enol-lactonase
MNSVISCQIERRGCAARLTYDQSVEAHLAAHPVLVLLHGFPLDHRMWDEVAAELGRQRLTVIAPDLPGFGGSDAIGEVLRMDAAADWVASLLDLLEIDRPVHLAGLSMGGYIAMEFALRQEPRLDKLILCDTKAEADSDAARADRLRMAQEVGQRGVEWVAEAMIPKLIDAHAPSRQEALIDRLRRMILDAPAAAISAAQEGMAQRRSMIELLPTIEHPILALAGSGDQITPPEMVQRIIADAHEGRMVTIPGAGHLAPMENPMAVAEAIGAFLQSPSE